jgi:ubiquitin-conjugating enzyme E2 M
MSLASGLTKLVSRRLKDYIKFREKKNNDAQIVRYDIKDDTFMKFFIKIKILDGYYKDQTHVLFMQLNKDGKNYPDFAPYIEFQTPIWHTNINFNGIICLETLKRFGSQYDCGWNKAMNYESLLYTIIGLLNDGNENSAFNPDAGLLWKKSKSSNDYKDYTSKCQEHYIMNICDSKYQKILKKFDDLYKIEEDNFPIGLTLKEFRTTTRGIQLLDSLI